MKRHSDKYLINKTPVLQTLKTHIFYKDSTPYKFDYWYYQQNILVFAFTNDNKTTLVQLYYQHINNYKNTLQLIFELFDKIAWQPPQFVV